MSWSLRTHRAGKTGVSRRLLQDDNQMFEMRLLLLLKTPCRRGKKGNLASSAFMAGCAAEGMGRGYLPSRGSVARNSSISGILIFS